MNELSSLEDTLKITQSYLFTTARYDLSVTQKRILYRIVELLQILYEGKSMKELKESNFRINTDLFGRQSFMIPTCKVLNEDDNHTAIRRAFEGLIKKTITLVDNDIELVMLNIFQKAKYHKNTGVMEFVPTKELLLTFELAAVNWKSYELAAAFSLKSTYSMRFFELFNSQKQPISYTIKEMKRWFGAEKKYSSNYDFFRYVLEVARKELKESCPVYFTYKKNKSAGSRSYTSVTFFIHQNPKNIKPARILRKVEDYLPVKLISYLKSEWHFTDTGILNNINDFCNAHKKLKWQLSKFDEIKATAVHSRTRNMPGYLIKSIRDAVENPKPVTPKTTYRPIRGLFD
tara:strand:+ start:336 stop:1373 length:1038 start_codon:yes stop_codon:yes gene_type:complete